MKDLRLIGYWRPIRSGATDWMSDAQKIHNEEMREHERRLPDPSNFVDPHWAQTEREVVANHLEVGTLVNQYRGLSDCRFCGKNNGSSEVTDGSFLWPEGLAHYVLGHGVRLPREFVDHVNSAPHPFAHAPRPTFDDLGQRDRLWPGPKFEGLFWMPEDADPKSRLYVDADTDWWLQQTPDW